MKHRLAVNPITCTGHGLCADMLPELIGIDEWGYPILADRPVPHELSSLARRAVRVCPTLALRLERVDAERKAPTSPKRGGSADPASRPAASPVGRPAANPAIRLIDNTTSPTTRAAAPTTRPAPAARPTSHRAGPR